MLELGELSELKEAAEELTKRDEVLAVEWFQKRRLFGIKADINEMAKFNSKIRKQEELEPPKK